MTQIALVIHTDDKRALAAAAELRERRGEEIVDLKDATAPALVVALGGDGTLIKAVHCLKDPKVPILGIRFGKLGFLSGALAEDMHEAVTRALEGESCIEERAMLDLSAWSGDQQLTKQTALNEVLVGRGGHAGILTTALTINGHHIYTQSGDGLLAATATGSTAYALSAGGPILSPDYLGMALVPLASHTLVNRSIVTSPDDKVGVTFPDPDRSDVMITIDGMSTIKSGKDKPMTHVEIMRSDRVVRLVKLDKRLFFDTLATEFFGKA